MDSQAIYSSGSLRVFEETCKNLERYGITGLTYVNTDPDNLDPATSKAVFLHSLPEEWHSQYFELGYHDHDHMAVSARSGNRNPMLTGPSLRRFLPSMSDKSEEVMLHAQEAGVNAGLCLSLNSNHPNPAHLSASTLCSAEKGSSFLKMLRGHAQEVQLIINRMHQTIQPDFIKSCMGLGNLTDRQKDCLKYLAEGVRISELSYKLGISEDTANFHLRNIRKTLKSRTTIEAVAKAISLRLL